MYQVAMETPSTAAKRKSKELAGLSCVLFLISTPALKTDRELRSAMFQQCKSEFSGPYNSLVLKRQLFYLIEDACVILC